MRSRRRYDPRLGVRNRQLLGGQLLLLLRGQDGTLLQRRRGGVQKSDQPAVSSKRRQVGSCSYTVVSLLMKTQMRLNVGYVTVTGSPSTPTRQLQHPIVKQCDEI